MPQGSFKKPKTQAPNSNKQKHQKQALGLKKGSFQIAPKKTRHLEAAKLQKTVDKAIKTKVEKELTLRATDSESKSFKVSASTSQPRNVGKTASTKADTNY
jgi:hypothetical protein